MWEINLELQKKIRRLMFLKYKKHKRIANLSLACIFLYSLLVFLVLSHFCTIEFEISRFPKICLIIFAVFLLVFMLAQSMDDISKLAESSILYTNKASFFSIKNIFALSFLFWIAMIVSFILLYDDSISHLFFLFLWMSVCFFILCFSNKRRISRDNVLFIYFIFFFVFLWPVVEASIDGIPVVAKIWKILFSISPFLMILFRSSFTDFLWSGYFIRRRFKIKDSEVWNCPGCHWYIMKKPIRYCPHCGNDSWALDNHLMIRLCKKCGSFMKIRETDFPNFCPHCGLAFKSKHPRTYS